MNEKLFIVAEAVQLVKDGKGLCLVCIERGWKNDAISNAAGKDFAGDGVALHAAGSEGGREVKVVDEAKEAEEETKRSGEWRATSGETKSHKDILLIAEGLDRIEASGARGGIEAGSQADEYGEKDAAENEPKGNRRNVYAREILPVQIDVGTKTNRTTDQPSNNGSGDTPEKAHNASFNKKKLLNVAVSGTKGFHDTNLSPALKDRHDKRVDYPESSDGKSDAAKDAEKDIQDREETAQGFGRIEKGECAEAEILELGFCGLHERRAFHANGKAGISGLATG